MNPYLDQQQFYRQQRSFRIKIYVGASILLLVLMLILYILVYSPIFQVRDFNISGNDRLPKNEVVKILEPLVLRDKIKNFLGIKNLLAWNTDNPDVSKTALALANIKRDWIRQSVNIDIKERERLAIWCDKNNNCYWIDREGTAFEEAPQTEGQLILTVRDQTTETVIKGTKVIEDRFVKNLVRILNGILEFKMSVKRIAFDKKLQELRLETYPGPDFLFSVRFDPILNLASLKSLQEKIELKGIKYFDLRVENRIYYKNL